MDVPAAVMALYDSLAFPDSKPPIHRDAAPAKAVAADGPEFVVLSDVQADVQSEDELHLMEVTRFALTVYAASQERADAIAEAIRYGGQDPRYRAGLSFAPALPALTGRRHLHLVPKRGAPRKDDKRGPQAGPAFRVRLEYEALTVRP